MNNTNTLYKLKSSYKTIIFIFTILFSIPSNSQVTQEWVNRFNGTGNSEDLSRKVLVDEKSGDVYVTGRSYNLNGNQDIVTIKYNSAGNQKWIRTYNGIFGADDPLDMVFDNSGSIIITGITQGRNSGLDCVTLKYDSFGSLLWTKKYNGTANGNDYGWSVCIDSKNDVIISGKSKGRDIVTGIHSLDDIITIKYTSQGIEKWVQRYNDGDNLNDGSFSILTDQNDDIYVTGYSGSQANYDDIITIKYTSQGALKWIKKHETAEIDIGYKNLINQQVKEIYSLGRSGAANIILCYDYSGVLKWHSTDIGAFNSFSSAAIDTRGKITVCGSTALYGTTDYMVRAYDPVTHGGLIWYDVYNGIGSGYDYPNIVIADRLDNVYVTGKSAGLSGLGSEYTTIKYDRSGVRLWEIRYSDAAAGENIPLSIAADYTGNVYVTGISMGSATGNFDYAVVKYSQATQLKSPADILPSEFSLSQNYPNPFNPVTVIKFSIPYRSNVRITVYNLNGQAIKEIINGSIEPGSHEIIFDGSSLSSGTYFCKMETDGYNEIKKMVLIK